MNKSWRDSISNRHDRAREQGRTTQLSMRGFGLRINAMILLL